MFHGDRVNDPLRHGEDDPLKIFVGSVTDVGGKFIEREWMERTLRIVRKAPWHTFQFLTKRPQGLWGYCFPRNAWVGITVTRTDDLRRVPKFQTITAGVKFISFEPLLETICPGSIFATVHWIIIGPQTGPGAPAPEREAVEELLRAADAHGVRVFMKKALRPWVDAWGLPWRREFPEV